MKIKCLFSFLVFLATFSIQVFSAESLMSQEHAQTLAYAFFKKEVGINTASLANGVDRGKSWEFQPYLGVNTKPTFRKIRVSKQNGNVYFWYFSTNIFKFLFP